MGGRKRSVAAPSSRFRPGLESLDDRLVPSATVPDPPPNTDPGITQPAAVDEVSTEVSSYVVGLGMTLLVSEQEGHEAALLVREDGSTWLAEAQGDNTVYTLIAEVDPATGRPASVTSFVYLPTLGVPAGLSANDPTLLGRGVLIDTTGANVGTDASGVVTGLTVQVIDYVGRAALLIQFGQQTPGQPNTVPPPPADTTGMPIDRLNGIINQVPTGQVVANPLFGGAMLAPSGNNSWVYMGVYTGQVIPAGWVVLDPPGPLAPPLPPAQPPAPVVGITRPRWEPNFTPNPSLQQQLNNALNAQPTPVRPVNPLVVPIPYGPRR